ncbi:phytoene/squalene synthase family protein [Angustibacter sp. McL0619]|uniref:phytoene/squalene synthase family protein n=1 Tax=Angustibacter sp. McL0619 TaxID=3415676 RepID=UPI003CEDDC29
MKGWFDRCLDAAGIHDPRLRAAYEQCRQVNALHGKTYYLSSLLLPQDRRPHVFALYAFSRKADEFVDDLEHPDPEGLVAWGESAMLVLGKGTGITSAVDPVVTATAHTVAQFDLDLSLFADFLTAMRQDIDTTRYETFEDLRGYMWGSAAVIGLMMLPLLGPIHPAAREHAIALGEAFQLANFIRDVGEDLQRGRVYLPMQDLAQCGVTPEDLANGQITPAVRSLLQLEIRRARETFAFAQQGVALVRPESRPCLATAITLYRGILDEVEKADYQVLTRRVSVPDRTRAAVALPALGRAVLARREAASWHSATPG